MALPNTGFVSAKSAADTVMLKLIRKVNSPGFCKTIEIINQPSPNSSPFVGSSEFTLVPDQLYHEHYAWTNGAETLSYVPVKGRDYGNWLIGNEPGVDNGYVYLGTSMPSLTPINLEGADSDHQWKWLIDMKWEDQPQMRAICKDTYKPGNVYYEIEYFDQITRQAVKSAFVPDLNPFILSLHRQLNPRFDQPEFQSKEANLLIPFPSYFEVSTRTWRLLDGITVVAEFGSPVMISRTKQQTGASESHIGVLVNEEHSGKFGWRLAFRNYAFSHLRGERNATARSKATQTLVLEPSITQIGYKPFKSTLAAAGVIPTSGAATQASLSPDAFVEYTEEEEQEYTVEIDNDGCLDDYRLEPLPSPVRRNFQRSMQHAWETIRPGDYVWLWHTRVHRGPGNFTSVGVSATGDVTTGRIPLSERSSYDNDWQTDEVSELLVRCKSRSNSTLIFQYFHTDRRDVMRQSFLDRDTDYFVVQLSPPGAAAQPLATFRGRAVQVKTTIVLGADIVNYVRRFLLMKEGKTHGLSSCYMYHAAVSMPQALIYGAEILCVLIGSKPVTMVSVGPCTGLPSSTCIVTGLCVATDYRFSIPPPRTTSGSSRSSPSSCAPSWPRRSSLARCWTWTMRSSATAMTRR